MTAHDLIRILTVASLAGLLIGVGLRLRIGEVAASVRRSRLSLQIALNFVVVPILAITAAKLFGLSADQRVALILLAASPFAPVVPVFARMAKADLALAAGLTALFPILSAALTPAVCWASLWWSEGSHPLSFNPWRILAVLVATITLPLALGVAVNHWAPGAARRCLRPIEVLAEAAGACSLAYVTFAEFEAIRTTGGASILATLAVAEAALVVGFALGGPDVAARRVTALGANNRNIALALLVSLDGFAGTAVVPAVVANGLALIGSGLLHVGWWRWRGIDPPAAGHRSSP